MAILPYMQKKRKSEKRRTKGCLKVSYCWEQKFIRTGRKCSLLFVIIYPSSKKTTLQHVYMSHVEYIAAFAIHISMVLTYIPIQNRQANALTIRLSVTLTIIWFVCMTRQVQEVFTCNLNRVQWEACPFTKPINQHFEVSCFLLLFFFDLTYLPLESSLVWVEISGM